MNAVAISMYTEYMMNAWGASGMFLFYSSLNLAGYFFVKHCMRETYGKSDKDKKCLYQPDQNENTNNDYVEVK